MEPQIPINDSQKVRGVLGKLIYFAAYVQPFVTLPQVYDIWISHKADASLATWAAYLGFSVIWFAYALKINDKPLIITYILWLIFETLIVVGLLTR